MTTEDLYIKFIISSNLVSTIFIVSHCYLLFLFLRKKEKKKDEVLYRRKICWNNLIRGSRSMYYKISQDSEMSVIHIIIG